MVSSLASIEARGHKKTSKRWPRRPSSAGPRPPSPVHGASKAMLIDGRPGSPLDLCSTDSHVLRRKCGARYKMCSIAQPVSTVLEGSTCNSSYEGPRRGSSRSDHTGNPEVASVTEDPPSIRCEHATPEDACRLRHGGNPIARTSRAAELAAVSPAVSRSRTPVRFTQERA